jgi:hypothetical protein
MSSSKQYKISVVKYRIIFRDKITIPEKKITLGIIGFSQKCCTTMFPKEIRFAGQLGTGERCVDVSARQVKQVHPGIAIQAKTTFEKIIVFDFADLLSDGLCGGTLEVRQSDPTYASPQAGQVSL